MEGGVVAEVVLPLAIFLIMVSLGTALVPDDFRRVLSSPREVGVGLLCQLVLLPLLGFAVAVGFDLEAVFAVSIVLLAAAPGGTTSNLVVHAADSDRALSVTLTALSNSVVWLTMPFLLGVAFDVFPIGARVVDFPVGEVMVQVAGLTIVPVAVGMGLRARAPRFCDRIAEPSRLAAGAFLALVIVALVVQNWDEVVASGPRFAPAFVLLSVVALATGWSVARLARVGREQALTIAVETGLQNSTLAITIAISVLGRQDMAIIPGLYGVWMLATGFGLAMWRARRRPTAAAPAGAAG